MGTVAPGRGRTARRPPDRSGSLGTVERTSSRCSTSTLPTRRRARRGGRRGSARRSRRPSRPQASDRTADGVDDELLRVCRERAVDDRRHRNAARHPDRLGCGAELQAALAVVPSGELNETAARRCRRESGTQASRGQRAAGVDPTGVAWRGPELLDPRADHGFPRGQFPESAAAGAPRFRAGDRR